jgi:hypothetical protein
VRPTLIAAALVAALLSVGGPGEAIELADGELLLEDSLEGQPVFSADNIGPGDSTSGNVTLSNAGTLAGQLSLSQSSTAGSALAEQLELVVQDVTGTPATVYSGPLSGLGSLGLGTMAPGSARVYSFTATLPASADQSVAGASVEVDYTWTASEVEVPPPPPPPGDPGATSSPDPTTPLRAPLKLSVRVPAQQPVVKRGWLVAYVRCDQRCTVEAQARLGGALRSQRARVRNATAGREVKLVLKLSKRTRAKLRRARRAPTSMRVTVTARTSVGARRTVAKRARIAVARASR